MQDYRHILIAAGHSPGFVRQLWAHVLRAQGPAARRYVAYWQRLCLAEEAKAQAARIAVSGVLSDPVAVSPSKDFLLDAESALIALGYKPAEASKAVAAANDPGIDSSEELIRRALKNMVNR